MDRVQQDVREVDHRQRRRPPFIALDYAIVQLP